MTKSTDLEFCFKGNRKYVHGTDIFLKLIEEYNNNIEKIDIAFHGITVNNMTFFTEKPLNKDIKVAFRYVDGDMKIKYFGVENNHTITCQYDYDEEKIVNNTTIMRSGESITLDTQTEYSFIEHIVAMNKALLEELYSDIQGKWYFTRLQLKHNITMSTISSLRLHLKSNFQFKLTKSSIVVNNTEIGFIYFSLIPKES